MPAADFVAAQERLIARRQARDRANKTAAAQLANERRQSYISQIPSPLLQKIGFAGQSAWRVISGREGTNPAFRVGQVDAELLDEELLELLKNQFSEGLKYYGSNLAMTYSPEILLFLRAALFKLSVWDHNASYGASLQGLRFADARRRLSVGIDGSVVPDSSLPVPSTLQKSVYGLVTVFGRYGWTKWNDYLADQTSGFSEPDPLVKQLSKASSLLESAHALLSVPSFALFLLTGKYRTILDRVLRLRLVPAASSISRDISFEYLNRQLVWHAFTEFLLFMLPLVGVSRWRKVLRRCWTGLSRLLISFKRLFSPGSDTDAEDDTTATAGPLGYLPVRTCAICYFDQTPGAGADGSAPAGAADSSGAGVIGSALTDITNPYEASPCGCVYCFSCLSKRLESEGGDGWTCLRCSETVTTCQPWSGDVVYSEPKKTADGGVSTPTRRLSVNTPPYSPASVNVASPETGFGSRPPRKSVGFAESVPLGFGDAFPSGASRGSNHTSFHDRDGDYGVGTVSDGKADEPGLRFGNDSHEDDSRSARSVGFSALSFSDPSFDGGESINEWARSDGDQSEGYEEDEDEIVEEDVL